MASGNQERLDSRVQQALDQLQRIHEKVQEQGRRLEGIRKKTEIDATFREVTEDDRRIRSHGKPKR